jgi:hypothetical protein
MAGVLTSDMEGTYGFAGKSLANRTVLEKPATIEMSEIECGNPATEANTKFRLASLENQG